MERLIAQVKKYPLIAAMSIVALGTLLGTFFGWAYAYQAAHDITRIRSDDPNDPLDMLPLVVSMYLAMGFFGGAIAGLFTGTIVYILNRKRV
jgi:hypothetical protein